MPKVISFHQAIPGFLTATATGLELTLSIKGDQPETVYVRSEPDNEEVLTSMSIIGRQGEWCRYQAMIPIETGYFQIRYLFKLVWADRLHWYSALGLSNAMPENNHQFRYVPEGQVPDWVEQQVFYQIFPDRFANGDHRLTPAEGAYDYHQGQKTRQRQWGERPLASEGAIEFFGGDLRGIEQNLPYLQEELGVTALYLNPVFESRSNHKYDTTDYSRVDPHLGGDEALVSLSATMHQRGMKLVLDAVINHTSVYHPWFQAAMAGDEQARARYVFDDRGDYASWKGHRSLPVLDFANEDNIDTFITGEDAVVKHWLRTPFTIDGWRMDVIHMLGEGAGAHNNAHYVRMLRKAVKSENPEAYLLGEHFFEATSWLQGDQEDAAMNYYGFGHPVRAFFTGLDIAYHPTQLDAADFADWLARARAAIPFSQLKAQLNQLDSHDTRRLISMLNGQEDLYQAAIGFLMTYIGTPCLYYGDELALPGEDDPDCRRCFPWDRRQWPESVFAATRRWISQRKSLKALQNGALVTLYAVGDVLVFARVLETQQCLIAVNRGDAVELVCPDELLPLAQNWTLKEGEAQLTNAPLGWQLDVPARSTSLWAR